MPSGLKRYQTSGHDHFITFTCYHQFHNLTNDHSKLIFEQSLEILRQRHDFFVFGYVLMPNHVHLLLSEPKRHLLAATLRVLKTETSKKLKGAREHFWQKRYYDRNIITQDEFVEKLRYIHRNPVEEGLVERPEDWPWSSYCHWLTGERGRIEIESHWTWTARERAAPAIVPAVIPKEQSARPQIPGGPFMHSFIVHEWGTSMLAAQLSLTHGQGWLLRHRFAGRPHHQHTNLRQEPEGPIFRRATNCASNGSNCSYSRRAHTTHPTASGSRRTLHRSLRYRSSVPTPSRIRR